ncbi:MAG TPA: epoxyqueuosine reductase [Desulfobacteraceae bacterium]|nr:epoxyqueuosine reductase [Desulfobacteraceae bacterium]
MPNVTAEFLGKSIEEFILERQEAEGAMRWRKPLVAFSDAADPMFLKLKEAVSSTHALPGDLLPGARTVIVYFIPFVHEIALSNSRGKKASEKWAEAYVATNRLIRDLNGHLALLLDRSGFRSAVLPPTHNFDANRLISDWSHKHVAYVAGLGAFGRHRLLITSEGCCGRLGSLITTAGIPVTPRTAQTACLHEYNGTCGVCIDKCPPGALTADALDRHLCYRVLLENARIYEHLGLADVCGKCCCVTPCSFKNPVERIGKKKH